MFDSEAGTLPTDWTPRYGLSFPIRIIYKNEYKYFTTYQEYHEFINELFDSKKKLFYIK